MTSHRNQPYRTLLRTGLPVLLLILLVCFLPSPVWACDCMTPGTPGEELVKSELVFLGKVVGFQTDGDLKKARFVIEKIWKGGPIESKFIFLDSNPQGCGYAFLNHRRYLVYTDKWGSEGEYKTYNCTRTKIANDVEMEMVFLDLVVKETEEKTIYKTLLIEAQSHPSERFRKQALDFIKDGAWPNFENLPEDTLRVLKDMTTNSNYEPRDHAIDILEWLELIIEGRQQSGLGSHLKE